MNTSETVAGRAQPDADSAIAPAGSPARRGPASLIALTYDDLRALAREVLRRQRGAAASRATSVVHEVYARLAQAGLTFESPHHFLRTAARAMRFVLVDDWRRSRAARRSPPETTGLPETAAAPRARAGVDVVAVHELLEKLGELDRQKADVVELRFFGGLTVEETAAALSISAATVKRDWAFARAWLHRALDGR